MGVDGLRKGFQFYRQSQQYAKRMGQKVSAKDAVSLYVKKQFVPQIAKTLVVDLMYAGASYVSQVALRHLLGFDTSRWSPHGWSLFNLMSGGARNFGVNLCNQAYDSLFDLT